MDKKKAVFAAGCFWGVEAHFQEIPGVIDTIVGYTGGEVKDPTYQMVCSKKTGHAEAVMVTYDPQQITYEKLVREFFKMHNPTTLNRQGFDFGDQYRSAIFYDDEEQHKIAEEVKMELNQNGIFRKPIVTEIVPAKPFYEAEDYHQRYYAKRNFR